MATSSNGKKSVTIVCCIESGGMEDQTLRMCQSVRKFGGSMADANIYAVKPRPGPGISSETRKALDAIRVEYIDVPQANRIRWLGWLNKLGALATVEARCRDEYMVWLDSDVIACDEFGGVLPADGEDVCARDEVCYSITETDSSREAWWRAACSALGANSDDLPWIESHEGVRIKLSLQSGVVAWRRSTNLAAAWQEACYRMVDRQIVMSGPGIYMTDQLILAPTVLSEKLRVRVLPWEYNAEVTQFLLDRDGPEKLSRARLLHYHEMMWKEQFEGLLKALANTKPEIAQWLRSQGALKDVSGPIAQLHRKVIRKYWQRTYDRYFEANKGI